MIKFKMAVFIISLLLSNAIANDSFNKWKVNIVKNPMYDTIE